MGKQSVPSTSTPCEPASLSRFQPPRTLAEAVQAARAAALLELRHAIPRGTPPDKFQQMLTDGTALTAARRGTYLELEPFLSDEMLSDETLDVLDVLEEKVAESAVEQWSATVASADAVGPSVTSDTPSEPHLAVQDTSLSGTATTPVILKPPFDSKDLDRCFVSACEEYHDGDFPLDIPFEALSHEVRELFVYRGRMAAFRWLNSSLPWDVAVRLAEAIGEAVWHVHARELASPSTPLDFQRLESLARENAVTN